MLTVLRHSQSVTTESFQGFPGLPLLPASKSTHATGRGAVLHISAALKARGISRALVPAYAPEGLIAPLIQSGMQCEFYRLTDGLFPDLESVQTLLDRRDERAVVVVIHFFGFPKVTLELRSLCSSSDSFLLEDFGQALLTRDSLGQPLIESASLSFLSFNKFLPVCAGALAFSKTQDIEIAIANDERDPMPDSVLTAYSDHLDAVGRLVGCPTDNEGDFQTLFAHVGETYEKYYSFINPVVKDWRSPYCALPFGAPPFDYEGMAARRRRNAELLYGAADWDRWQLVEPDLCAGVIPFAIPIRVPFQEREEIVKRLRRKGVWLGVLQEKWDHIPLNCESNFPVEAQLLASCVLAPISEWITTDRIVAMTESLNAAEAQILGE